jgi:RimJ/RimL family protein N-acetyltransferase
MVQNWIRTRFNPNAAPGEVKLVGADEKGIAGVAWARQEQGPDDFQVLLAAVELRCRHCGGHYAREMVAELLDRLYERASNEERTKITVTARIDPMNRASRKLMQELGGSVQGTEGALEIWTAVRDVPRID